MPAPPPVLAVHDLRVRFDSDAGGIDAVEGVSFQLERGETLALVGESGSGKSVTALAVMRLLPRPAGRVVGGGILFEGRDLSRHSEAEMRRVRGTEIGMVFQEPMTSLNPVLTAGARRPPRTVPSWCRRSLSFNILGDWLRDFLDPRLTATA